MTYAIEQLIANEWQTIYESIFLSPLEVRLSKLMVANPQTRYRLVEVQHGK